MNSRDHPRKSRVIHWSGIRRRLQREFLLGHVRIVYRPIRDGRRIFCVIVRAQGQSHLTGNLGAMGTAPNCLESHAQIKRSHLNADQEYGQRGQESDFHFRD